MRSILIATLAIFMVVGWVLSAQAGNLFVFDGNNNRNTLVDNTRFSADGTGGVITRRSNEAANMTVTANLASNLSVSVQNPNLTYTIHAAGTYKIKGSSIELANAAGKTVTMQISDAGDLHAVGNSSDTIDTSYTMTDNIITIPNDFVRASETNRQPYRVNNGQPLPSARYNLILWSKIVIPDNRTLTGPYTDNFTITFAESL